jgi:hypothetical protein
MKYKISDLRTGEYKELDISEFFPSATEPVIIKIKRLTEKKRSDVVELTMHGQSIKAGGDIDIQDMTGYRKAREKRLLNGVVLDDSFPFEKWDEKFIEEIGEKCPELIGLIHDAIQEFNLPLAEKSEENSSE